MNLFPNPTYNGYFIKGGSTAKPIAGVCTETAYNKPLNQVVIKNMKGTYMQGFPVGLKNKPLNDTWAGNQSNNTGLSGNVFYTDSTIDSIEGFIVNSPNDILLDGDSFPRFLPNQVARVATIGSKATVYLPVNTNCSNIQVNQKLYWDKTNNEVTTDASGVELPGVKIRGQVVDGLIPYYDSTTNVAQAKDGLVARIQL